MTLDRLDWYLRVTSEPKQYSKQPYPASECKQNLVDSIEKSIDGMQLNLNDWLLALSGGYDSRAIFQQLCRTGKRIKTVTWGNKLALQDKRSDACVAGQLAGKYECEHTYFELDSEPHVLDPAIVLGRFVECTEGRSDNLSGYIDGFSMWRRIFTSSCHGIIRGDEQLGYSSSLNSEFEVFRNWGYVLLNDYANASLYRELVESLPEQIRSDVLFKNKHESFEEFKARFQSMYDIPNVPASFTAALART